MAILLGAINPGANTPEFVRSLNLPFPVGECDNDKARQFMEFPTMQMAYVPWLSFIDRSMNIRHQFQGTDKHVLSDEMGTQEKNIRKYVDALLAEKAAPSKAPPAVKKAVPKK